MRKKKIPDWWGHRKDRSTKSLYDMKLSLGFVLQGVRKTLEKHKMGAYHNQISILEKSICILSNK